MHAISSAYYHEALESNSDETSRVLTKGFEDGYNKCLLDLGIKEKDHPKGNRENK